MSVKVCTKCQLEKKCSDDYHKQKGGKQGLSASCKSYTEPQKDKAKKLPNVNWFAPTVIVSEPKVVNNRRRG